MTTTTNNTKKAPVITKAMRNTDILALLNKLDENSELVKNLPNGSKVADLIAHVERENELLARKSNRGGKSSKVLESQQKNMDLVLEYLSESDDSFTASQIMAGAGLESTSQATAALRRLIDAGKVEREEIKGRAYFSLKAPKMEIVTEMEDGE